MALTRSDRGSDIFPGNRILDPRKIVVYFRVDSRSSRSRATISIRSDAWKEGPINT